VPAKYKHVFGLAFTPDGNTLVIGGGKQARAGGAWRFSLHLEGYSPPGNRRAFAVDHFAAAIAFSSDGKWMALSGGAGGEPVVRFHQSSAEEPTAQFHPPATRTRCLRFAPDRPLLAIVAGKQCLLLVPGESEPAAVLAGRRARERRRLPPDGRHLFGRQDGTLRAGSRERRAARVLDWGGSGRPSRSLRRSDGSRWRREGQIVLWDVDCLDTTRGRRFWFA
jgi:hypothetical protein